MKKVQAGEVEPLGTSNIPAATPPQPQSVGLPRSDSIEAREAIEAVCRERGHPCAPKANARIGWEAAYRWLAGQTAPNGSPTAADGCAGERPRTNLEKALVYYRAAFLHKAPPFVPARVKVLSEVFGDPPLRGAGVAAGEYECQCNQWGAVSVLDRGGQLLGLRPHEFYPVAWRVNAEAEALPVDAEPWPSGDPWALAVDEALIASGLDCTTPQSDPKLELARLLEWTTAVALDPAVSAQAQALIDRGCAMATGALATPPGGEPLAPAAGLPDDIRAAGWTVAVHNDYRLGGVPHTFWLFTNQEGRAVKGEGRTDAQALDEVRRQLWPQRSDLPAPEAPARASAANELDDAQLSGRAL